MAAPAVVRTYCTLCGVGCPAAITISGTEVLKLEPDHDHPDGGAVCAKGRAAPEIHASPHRVNYPVVRTAPKTVSDPGWRRVSWDEALGLVAERLLAIREESGPQAIAFGRGTGSGTGLSPTEPWVARLAGAFGSPNYMTNTHICNWARDGANYYTFGTYEFPLPEVEKTGCLLLWGSNPTATLLNLATRVVAARQGGMRLVVIDPRRIGLANKADHYLGVRPGTDGALALAFIRELIEHRWYDDEFVRNWTNAPLLVREDTQRLLQATDVDPAALRTVGADPSGNVGIGFNTLAQYAPQTGRYAIPTTDLDLLGTVDVPLGDGQRIRCRTVFNMLAAEARRFEPTVAEAITGVSAGQIRDAVAFMVANRPLSYHTWNGIVQHTNATLSSRAISVFYALMGDWDQPGGNVTPGPSLTKPISLDVTDEQAAWRLGRNDRPLGPQVAPPRNIVSYDLFSSVLEGRPYPVRGLVSFGSNTIINSADPVRGREALQKLEFFVQAELFRTPTSQLADVLLPAASFLETEFLVIRHGKVQRRPRSVEPLYERRPDVEVIFDLGVRLGLGDVFANGDLAAAYNDVLEPMGVTWDQLGDHPHGLEGNAPVAYEKYAQTTAEGAPRGFATPSRRIEIFLDSWAAHGVDPLPVYREPAESPRSTPDLAQGFPLVLTNAKKAHFLQSQHRGVARLRRLESQASAEINPDTAARYGITHGQWIEIATPRGRARAQAQVTDAIVPGVVCAYHGWWEGCEALGLEPSDPYDERGSNVNLLVHGDLRDPISGALPHRSALCSIRALGADELAIRQS
jgi:anaerobic selenocysteine-containing dehydrogenase